MRDLGLAAAITVRRAVPARREPPDYLIIGAQKSGTSTLAARLVAHPQVVAPLLREVHYFDFASDRPRAWYEAQFPTAAQRRRVERRHGRAITGEGSPSYLLHPAVPARVHAMYPEVRLIALLRDPTARAVSEYHHAVRHGFERRPIEEALVVPEPRVLDVRAYDDPNGDVRRHSYIERGHYAEQLARWFDVFPRDQLLVLTLDELETPASQEHLLGFLGLDDLPVPPVANQNVHPHAGAPAVVVEVLRAHYRPYNDRLAALLGRTLPWDAPDTSAARVDD